MEIIKINDIELQLIRSPRRKTVALSVKQGTVSLRIPSKLPTEQALSFARQKINWITEKLQQSPATQAKQFISGERFLLLGQPLSLELAGNAKQNKVEQIDNQLYVASKSSQPAKAALAKQITRWYRQQAQQYLSERCWQLAAQYGFSPETVEIKAYKARWGSCNIRQQIQLNWKLIMAPIAVIDYVIIHELCHLKQHNHSPAFWQLVKQFCPDYPKHRNWLKQHGNQLSCT